MRLWFEWNGINSQDFGIVLSQVPDIIKPKKRIKETYLDGINGSDVEELGYSAYVKQIKIGFKYDNVQEVEQWLTGSGKLVCCNEPEQYYDAVILDEIKYTHDIIYCHATINFYVQPIKHAVTEEILYGTNQIMIVNDGNEVALPLVNITGTGNVTLCVDSKNMCTLAFGATSRTLTLDCKKKDCLCNNVLANRSMQGEFPELAPGEHEISCTGTVTNMEVQVRASWV